MRLLVVDDHRVLAESMALVLDRAGRYADVRLAHSMAQARELMAGGSFGHAVVDVRLPDGDGDRLVPELRAADPESRVVVLTATPHARVVARGLAAGACAVLPKGTGLAELTDVLEGTAPAPAPVVDGVGAALTAREVDVLTCLAAGRDTRQCARELGISLHTVRDHLKNVHAKLGVSSQLDAVVTAHRAGVIDLDAHDLSAP